MTQAFNTREVATGIWLLVFAILASTKKDVRAAFAGLVRAFLHRQILVSVLLMIIYNAAVVAVLKEIGVWRSPLLKDTILWFLFTGFVTAFNLVSEERELHPLRKAIKQNLTLLIGFEFIVNTYTFPLYGELIFIPVLVLLVGMDVIAARSPEYQQVARIVTWLLALLGIAMISYSIVRMISDYKQFGTIDTLHSFAVPPLLTLLFLPFVWVLVLYVSYQSLFLRVTFLLKGSSHLHKYAKNRLVYRCRFNLARVRTALKENGWELLHATTREDVDRIIREGVPVT